VRSELRCPQAAVLLVFARTPRYMRCLHDEIESRYGARHSEHIQTYYLLAVLRQTLIISPHSTTQITDPYELQTHMINYEEGGTFDDFNEMAIQWIPLILGREFERSLARSLV
jgi:hypothetical protein